MKIFLVFFFNNSHTYVLECVKSTRAKAEEYISKRKHPLQYEIEVWDVDE
jgi:hypothetical protein